MSMLAKYVMSSEYLLNARASELYEFIVLQTTVPANRNEWRKQNYY